ncbi:MAG: acetoacetate--CoA ligase [Pseudomonadota bacterium]
MTMEKPLWTPDSIRRQSANLTDFMNWLAARGTAHVENFDQLHAFSVDHPERFWEAVWDHCGVVGDKGEAPFLTSDGSLKSTRFFPGGRLNYAETIVTRMIDGDALVFWGEDQVKRRVSANELVQSTARFGGLLDEIGIAPGDRVAAMLPNMPEAIAAVLGTAARGAIWSSCSPDFGAQGVLDRFGQINPRVLLVCDGYIYNGKRIDVSDKVASVVSNLPSVECVIVVSYLGQAREMVQGLNPSLLQRGDGARAMTWDDAVETRPETRPQFQPMPVAAPLFIMFSSGTTGVPKCIVHSAGGTLLKHLTEQRYHSDIKRGDHVFYFTTLGWMMWNWLVTCLGSGARLMLFDGSPFAPDGNVLWDYADKEQFSHFGTSAKYIDALKKADIKPRTSHQLTSLRTMLSTGSPLVPESFDYVYADIKSDVHLSSISGGTDIIGCFVLGNPIGPVYRGEIQAKALGLSPDVFDESGRPLPHGKGELVCTNAFPSMPVAFWNDDDGTRYHNAYFSRFDDIWHHGDFAEWTENGGMIIHGRSDATLNPGGVRIGTAEIYRQVEQLPEVVESLVIGQQWDGDVRVVLFVILAQGVTLDDALVTRIESQIRTGASPRHVPARVIAVNDIPRTKSGKITELAVRDIIHGRDVKNKEALANPEALDLYRGIAELQT